METSDGQPIVRAGAAATASNARHDPAHSRKAPALQTANFTRLELTAILRVYGMGISKALWRDYAIDYLKDRAVFSIFRRSGEYPLYRIEKHPKLRNRQGAFVVVAQSGQILKRGHDLPQTLKILERKFWHVVDVEG